MQFEGRRGVVYNCDRCGQEFPVTDAEQKIMIAMFGAICPECVEVIEGRVKGDSRYTRAKPE